MRFSSLSMKLSTHLRCNVGVIAAFLAHPKYKYEKELIHEAKKLVLGPHARWGYAFHLSKEEAHKALSSCLPEIIRQQQSTGMWKRKNANIFTYGILRALKHAGLLEQKTFRDDLYKSFQGKTDLISILVRKNIMNEKNIDVGSIVSVLFSTQQENGSWYNSLSATCFQLQALLELGIDDKHKLVTSAIKWLFQQFYKQFKGKAWTWNFDFENIFLTDNNVAEQEGFQQIAPEQGKMACVGSLEPGTNGYIKGNPAMTTAIALYTLTKLGYDSDERIIDAYKSLYNIRSFYEKNGEINEYVWCVGAYKPNSVHYNLDRTGISFKEYLQIVKERKTK